MSDLPNLFPALDAATEAALRSSIERFGVLVPVMRDQYGRTLDGHHRARIADDLGVGYRVDVIEVDDDEHARQLAATLNADRRHMSTEQRREVVAALREQGHSLRSIAGAVGVSEGAVRKDIAAEQVRTRTHLTPAEVVGQDGKRYPASRPIAEPEPDRWSEGRMALVEENAALDLLPAPTDDELRLPSDEEIKQAVGRALPGSPAPSSGAVRTWDARLKAASDSAAGIRELPAFPPDGDSSLELTARAVARALGDAATRLLKSLPEESALRRIK